MYTHIWNILCNEDNAEMDGIRSLAVHLEKNESFVLHPCLQWASFSRVSGRAGTPVLCVGL